MTRIVWLTLLVGCTASSEPLVLTGQISAAGPHPNLLGVEIAFGPANDHEGTVTTVEVPDAAPVLFETPAIDFSDRFLVDYPTYKMAYGSMWIIDPFGGAVPQRLQDAGYELVYLTATPEATRFGVEGLVAGWNLMRRTELGRELASIDMPLVLTLE